MKKILYLMTIAAIGLFSSCNDFLTANLKGDYTSANYYTSPEAATMAVTGIYNSLYGSTLWIFGDVASDDAVKGGNAGDQADINGINDFTVPVFEVTFNGNGFAFSIGGIKSYSLSHSFN